MTLRDLADTFYDPPDHPVTWRGVISWWEERRIVFNVFVAVYGLGCLAVFLWGILGSGRLRPGEDAIEPLALLGAPVAVNLCYTLGWLVEVPARLLIRALTPGFSPLLLKAGVVLSVALMSIPAVAWGGYHVLQLVGLAHR